VSALTAQKFAANRTPRPRYRQYCTKMFDTGATVTEPDRRGTDTADRPAQTPARNDALTKRTWWKNPALIAVAAVVLAAIGVGGFFGVSALLPHPSPQSTPRTLAQVPGLPAGAAECPLVYTDVRVPFNAAARGTPTTSCAFVEQARQQYSRQSPSSSSGTLQMSVISPTTEKWYNLVCTTTGNYVTCAGGAAAVIYLYNR
jgi:hypothetical protein